MYPDLSYLFHDLFGTATDNWLSIFKTFGLLVAMAVLTAAFLLKKELQRRAEIGQFQGVPAKIISNAPLDIQDYVLNAFFGFIVGFKLVYIVQNLDAMQADPASIIISGKGNWLAGIIGAGLLTAYYFDLDSQRKKQGIRRTQKSLSAR